MKNKLQINKELYALPYFNSKLEKVPDFWRVRDKDGNTDLVKRKIFLRNFEKYIIYKKQLVKVVSMERKLI